MVDWDSSVDRMTVADLEIYGLSLRSINALEEYFEVLYVDELETLTEERVRGIPYMGSYIMRELCEAVKNWRAGRPVKTVEECCVAVDFCTGGRHCGQKA